MVGGMAVWSKGLKGGNSEANVDVIFSHILGREIAALPEQFMKANFCDTFSAWKIFVIFASRM